MKNLCIIPARGGSKRIPRKNIKYFLGKPIIAYSIEAAVNSNLFDEVMVSTDDKEIAEIALKFGATIPFLRSEKNADDFATTVEVLIEVLSKYAELNQSFENVCCIYPCAPLVTTEKINEAYSLMNSENLQAVLPIVKYSFPIQRSFVTKNKKVFYKYPEYEKIRSQDLEATYHDAGQFYWIKIDTLNKEKSLIPPVTGFVELDEMEVQDIDNEMDWKLAEMKYQLMKK